MSEDEGVLLGDVRDKQWTQNRAWDGPEFLTGLESSAACLRRVITIFLADNREFIFNDASDVLQSWILLLPSCVAEGAPSITEGAAAQVEWAGTECHSQIWSEHWVRRTVQLKGGCCRKRKPRSFEFAAVT